MITKKLLVILGVVIISGSFLFVMLNQQQTVEIPDESFVQSNDFLISERLDEESPDASTVFATGIISSCGSDLDCALDSLREIHNTTDEETVLSTFKHLLILYDQNNFDCHRTVHHLGMFLYTFVGKNLSSAFKYAGQSCGGAVYHGVIMNYLTIERNNGVNPDEIEILDICPKFEENPYALERWQCLHGIGHGLEVVYDYDTFAAIERCEIFEPGWEQISCSKGMFMENNQLNVKTGKASFDEKDILYPCNKVELKYAPACYQYQPTYILTQVSGSLNATLNACDKIEPQELIKYCYHGVGRQMAPATEGKINVINLICQIGQPEFYKDCYRGMVMTFINNDHPLGGFDFCKAIPDFAKEDCYDGLGKWVIMIHSSDMEREKMCSHAESERYFTTCMNATLENISLL